MKAKHGAKQFDDAVKKIKRGGKDVDRTVKSNTKSFAGMGSGIKKVVVGMVGLTAAYKGLRFAQTAVKEIVAFEMELANVSTMLDEQTMQYLPGYGQALDGLAIKYGQSTATLSKGLYDILSASIEAGKAIGVLDVASKAAIGGLTDTGTAADALTTIINAYGMEAKDATKISDILFATVKRGKLTFGELASSIGNVIALAAAAGLSFEQASAMIATMTRSGIDATMAMTALKGIVTTFLSPQEQNIKMAAKFGLELNTNTLQTIGLTGALEKLKYATSEETAEIFSNVRALLGVAATRKSLSALIRDYEGMLNSAGMSEKAYQKIAATTQNSFNQFSQLLKKIKRDLGEGIKPELDLWMAGFKPFVEDWIRGWQAMASEQSKAQEIIDRNMGETAWLRLIPAFRLVELAVAKVYAGEIKAAVASEEASEAVKKFKDTMLDSMPTVDRFFNRKPPEWIDEFDEDSIPDVRIIKKYTEEQVMAGKAVTALFAELKREKDLIGLTTAERERAIKVMEFEAIAKKMGISNIKDLVSMYEKEVKSLQKLESRTEYLDDRAEAYRRLYNDLDGMGKTNYKRLSALLEKEYEGYKKLNLDKALLDEWHAGKKAAIDAQIAIASDNFFAGLREQIEYNKYRMKTWGEVGSEVADTLQSATSDAVISMAEDWSSFGSAMESVGISVARTIQKMIADMITAQIISAAIGAFGGGGGGGAASGQVLSDTEIMSMPNAKGAAFPHSTLRKCGRGDILSGPTIFPMSNGGLALGGEVGSEALMPLGRDKFGRLGVRTDEKSGGKTPIKIINVMDFSQVQEYLGTGDGERQIVNIMRRNSNEVQEVAD